MSKVKQEPRVIFGDGVRRDFAAVLSLFAPPLSAALFITSEPFRSQTARYYEKAASVAGFRIYVRTLPVGTRGRKADAAFTMPEDTKLIIGVGGGETAEICKIIAATKKIPLVFAVAAPDLTAALLPAATLYGDGTDIKAVAPSVLVCDTEFLLSCRTEDIAAAASLLFAKAVSLFDALFASYVVSEPLNLDGYRRGAAAIDKTIHALLSSAVCPAAVVAGESLAYSAAASADEGCRLVTGGEAQAARAIRIFLRQKGEPFQKGEIEAAAAPYILRLYKAALFKPVCSFLPPPDNGLRVLMAAERFGLNEKTVRRKVRPFVELKTLKSRERLIRQNRFELLTELCAAEDRLREGFSVLKRRYQGFGQNVFQKLGKNDFAMAVCLAPDLSKEYTGLSYLKDAGFLENAFSNLILMFP